MPASTPTSSLDRILNKFKTFTKKGGKNSKEEDYNVQFFNNYRYTLFVPSNEALAEAEAHGLPTWETIIADYESLPFYEDIWQKDTIADEYYVINDDKLDDDGNPAGAKIYVASNLGDTRCFLHRDSLRIQAEITYLNNFIRCHFLDNSIFADKTAVSETDYVTSSYDSELGIFVKVHCQRVKQGGQTLLQVHDDHGGAVMTVNDDLKNIMARDVILTRNSQYVTAKNQSTMNNIIIQGSSFCVLHQIPGVLKHTPMVKNKQGEDVYFDFDDTAACKAYLKKHAIPENLKDMKHYEE